MKQVLFNPGKLFVTGACRNPFLTSATLLNGLGSILLQIWGSVSEQWDVLINLGDRKELAF